MIDFGIVRDQPFGRFWYILYEYYEKKVLKWFIKKVVGSTDKKFNFRFVALQPREEGEGIQNSWFKKKNLNTVTLRMDNHESYDNRTLYSHV